MYSSDLFYEIWEVPQVQRWSFGMCLCFSNQITFLLYRGSGVPRHLNAQCWIRKTRLKACPSTSWRQAPSLQSFWAGVLPAGQGHIEEICSGFESKMMEKTPDVELVGLVEVRRIASLWMQSVRCCSTGYFCPAGSPPCRFLSLSSRSVSLSALAYVKALCCCCRERKWRVDICILNYVSD